MPRTWMYLRLSGGLDESGISVSPVERRLSYGYSISLLVTSLQAQLHQGSERKDHMILGMTLSTFTLFHVVLSLLGIASGLIVVYGVVSGKRLDNWTAFFVFTTVLTSATGFLFPFEH